MKYIKIIFGIFYFALSFRTLLAQSERLVFEPVNNSTLQQYNIRSINAGIDNKLWLSTDKGLLCYDGNDVKVFKHDDNDPSSLSSDNISKTYHDSNGNLYVINDFHEKNLSIMDGRTGKFTAADVQLNIADFRMMATPFAYTDLLIDDDGSVWLAAYYIGLVHYNMLTTRTNSYYFNLKYSGRNTVYTIKKDVINKQLLWLGTEDGIYSFNKKTKELKRNFRCTNPADSSAADLPVTNIDICNSDSIWFSVSGKGIGCYNIKTGSYTIYPIHKKKEKKSIDFGAIQIQRKSKNEYFVSTKYSLPGLFNTSTHQYSYPAITSPNLTSVLSNYFLVDNLGNYWCVLYNRLFKAHSKKDKFETIRINDGNNAFENAFRTIVWDEKRRVYYAAFEKGNGVLVLDTNFKVVKTIPVDNDKNKKDTPDSEEVHDLALDKKDRLWVCGTSLYNYDEASQKMIPASKMYPHLLFTNQQFQNLVIRNNDIYLQPLNFTSRAIYHINISTLASDSINLPEEIAKDKNYAYQPVKLFDYLVLDREGKYAYMSYSKFTGLDYIDCLIQLNLNTKKARRIKIIEGVEHNETSSLFNYQLDDNSRIWFETEDGIMIYEADSSHPLNNIAIDGELFSKQLYNIPGAGIMCRLNSRGVILYDYKNNNQIHLTLTDGLNSNSNSAIASANKNLFIGASNYIQYMPLASITGKQNTIRSCYLSSIQLFNHPYITDTLPETLHVLNMPHDKNFITLTFSCTEFEQPERLAYRYKMSSVDRDWVYVSYSNRTISYNDLKPGSYIFQAVVKNANGQWSNSDINLVLNIIPAWWQTTLFKVLLVAIIVTAVYLFVHWRITSIRKQEQVKGKYEKELLELEAKALRAQMNPHFIFNCMNSIKSLIQKNDEEHAVLYLTTFSKLIRTVFQNSDKREITLYDEIETCKLYLQLESMRFSNKFTYTFNADKTLDLKSAMVPALIVQPFIENAIWHGIMPKEDGGSLNVIVDKINDTIRCIIDDDGIGRELSKQNKFHMETSSHESKGEHLTQARLDLDNLLNERNAKIEIIDKQDNNYKACGTTVILTFNEF